MLQIKHFHAFSEEDIFNDGRQAAKTGNSYTYEKSFNALNQESILSKLCDHFSVTRDALELNACDDSGRIDIARIEDSEGCAATESELSQWRKGEVKLFYTVYTGYLETVTPTEWKA